MYKMADGITPITVLILALGALFVGGRIWSNRFIHKELYQDDYLCLLATASLITYAVCLLILNHNPYSSTGSTDTSDQSAILSSKLTYALAFLYSPTTFFSKSSVLLLYRRLFSPYPHIQLCVSITLSFAALVYTAHAILASYFCASYGRSATSHTWGSAHLQERCGILAGWDIAVGVLDSAMSLFIMVLPVPAVWSLQLTKWKKFGLVFLFMHGIFALVASLTSLSFRVGALAELPSHRLFSYTAVAVCTVVENGMTIVCSSMHACAAILRRIKEHRLKSTMTTKNSRGYIANSSGSGALRVTGGSGGNGISRYVEVKGLGDGWDSRSKLKVGSEVEMRKMDVEVEVISVGHDLEMGYADKSPRRY